MSANPHADAVRSYLDYLCASPKPAEATPWAKFAKGATTMVGFALGTGACFGDGVIASPHPIYGIGGGWTAGGPSRGGTGAVATGGVGGKGAAGQSNGGGGATSTGGMGGVDCGCTNGAYTPVCGADGVTHDAACGAACVPVDIACVGECPCDPNGLSCDVGCTAFTSSTYCDTPRVEWVCDGSYRASLLSGVGCEMLPTGAIRYCCPGGFLSACR